MRNSEEKQSQFNLGKLLIFTFGIAFILILAFYFLFINDTINLTYFDETASYKISGEDIRIEALLSPAPFEANDKIESIGTLSHKQALIVGGQQNLLFPTFDDKEAVFQNLQDEIPQLLSKIQEDYGLSTIHESNISEYAIKTRNYLDSFPAGTSGDAVLDEQIDTLRFSAQFVAHYRHNAEIIDYVVNAKPIDEQQLYMLMPNNSPFSLGYVEKNGSPMEQDLKSEAS